MPTESVFAERSPLAQVVMASWLSVTERSLPMVIHREMRSASTVVTSVPPSVSVTVAASMAFAVLMASSTDSPAWSDSSPSSMEVARVLA